MVLLYYGSVSVCVSLSLFVSLALSRSICIYVNVCLEVLYGSDGLLMCSSCVRVCASRVDSSQVDTDMFTGPVQNIVIGP